MTADPGVPLDFPIVAVGAAAGGLKAFATLLKGLPAKPGMAFVLIHSASKEETARAGNFSAFSPMPVMEAAHGAALKRDHVYIVPPETPMTIRNGALRRAQPGQDSRPHQPIDEFCQALAEDRKSAAVGILLSGRGSDGTIGLQSIRSQGGITFAQEPRSARWAAMPAGAISAGAADFVMVPRRISAELAHLAVYPKEWDRISRRARLRSILDAVQEETRAITEEILATNEELVSVNEELKSAVDSLQTANGELASLTGELQRSNTVLHRLSADLNNVLDLLDMPILQLDSALRIRRFTPAAEKLFRIGAADIGSSFLKVDSSLHPLNLLSLFKQATESGQMAECETQDRDGRWHLLRVGPYFVNGGVRAGRVEGVVIALIDIDSVKKNRPNVQSASRAV